MGLPSKMTTLNFLTNGLFKFLLETKVVHVLIYIRIMKDCSKNRKYKVCVPKVIDDKMVLFYKHDNGKCKYC